MGAATLPDGEKVLRTALADCVAGEGGAVVVVTGHTGSGKTRLLTRARQWARELDMGVLAATAHRSERSSPLRVLRRLMAAADLSDDDNGQVGRLLESAATDLVIQDDDAEMRPAASPVLHGMTRILLALAVRQPLLVTVDDLQYVDPGSVGWLRYLARRVRHARIVMVMSDTTEHWRLASSIRAEALSQPYRYEVRLGLLGPAEVAELIFLELEIEPSEEVVAAYLRASGGSPLLLRALIADNRAAGNRSPEVAAGEAFGLAVLTCLHRGSRRLRDLMRVLTILDSPAPVEVVGELLGLDVYSTTEALTVAEETGLVDATRLCHPAVRTAVLDTVSSAELAALHRAAAEALYRDDVPSTVVAGHLLSADRIDGGDPGPAPWSIPILLDAAEHAVDDRDQAFAFECLRLAERSASNPAGLMEVHLLWVRLLWRYEPSSAEPRVRDLVADVRSGRLTGQAALRVASYLLWYGRAELAVEILQRFAAASQMESPDTALAVYSIAAQLCYLYPELLPTVRGSAGSEGQSPNALAMSNAAAFVDDLFNAPGLRQVRDAERTLSDVQLTEASLGPIWAALEILVFAERLNQAAAWCDRLIAVAEQSQFHTLTRLICALRALVNLRQGNLSDAERRTRDTLSLMRHESWGVFVGLPLSVLIETSVLSGNLTSAARYLSTPVPPEMFRTSVGLLHLRAKGRFHLARQDTESAMAAFDTCRRLSVEWSRDVPGLVPWRSDIAEVLILTRHHGRARRLLYEQLERLGDGNLRTRGITLRLLATVLPDPVQKAAILEDTVRLLRQTDDHWELTRALADLEQVRQGLDPAQAAAAVAAMRHHPVSSLGRPGTRDNGTRAPGPADPAVARSPQLRRPEGSRAELSPAEQRVMILAAQGNTNRQIARRLQLTVSTVEQHLTRVYQKLGVRGRADLVAALWPEPGEGPEPP